VTNAPFCDTGCVLIQPLLSFVDITELLAHDFFSLLSGGEGGGVIVVCRKENGMLYSEVDAGFQSKGVNNRIVISYRI
jgi:hypothetical protein